jgi:NAD(P)-dependent dehydrogenase (short-subunit alcohol dehydrogenase family)
MSQNGVALVTGGSEGAGRAVALGLGEAGFAVGILARSPRALDETRDLLASDGVPSVARVADVRDLDEVDSAIGEIEDELGSISTAVNNAGTLRAVGPVWEVDPQDWWADVETSLKGAFNVSRRVIPGMLEQGTGRIINVSSYAALRAAPYQSGYGSAKAGLANLTESLNSSLRPFGIKVFTVTPGFVRTNLTKTLTESPEGRRWLPELGRRESLDLGLFVRLTVKIALGEADALDGRFLHALDDLPDLVGRASQIERDSLYVPRLRRLRLPGRKAACAPT